MNNFITFLFELSFILLEIAMELLISAPMIILNIMLLCIFSAAFVLSHIFRGIANTFSFFKNNVISPISFHFGMAYHYFSSNKARYKSLIDAIHDSNFSTVKQLLKLGVDAAKNDNFAILKAARENEIQIFILLISLPDVKANIAINNHRVLIGALGNKNYNIAVIILSLPEVENTISDGVAYNILVESIKSKNHTLVDKALANRSISNAYKRNKPNIFLMALEGGDRSIVEKLTQHEMLTYEEAENIAFQVAIVAVKFGWEDYFTDFLNFVSHRDQLEAEDNILLRTAVQKDRVEIVKILIKKPEVERYFYDKYSPRTLGLSVAPLYVDVAVKLTNRENPGYALVEASKAGDIEKVSKIIELESNSCRTLIHSLHYKEAMIGATLYKNQAIQRKLLDNSKAKTYLFNNQDILTVAIECGDEWLYSEFCKESREIAENLQMDEWILARSIAKCLVSSKLEMLSSLLQLHGINQQITNSKKSIFEVILNALQNKEQLNEDTFEKLVSFKILEQQIPSININQLQCILKKNKILAERLVQYDSIRSKAINSSLLKHSNREFFDIANRVEEERNQQASNTPHDDCQKQKRRKPG